MKDFIRQRLREDLEYNYVVGDATKDEYELTEVDSEMTPERLKAEIDSLPSTLTLFRVVYVNHPSEINEKKPGTHYVLNKRDLERSHYQGSHVGGGEPLMLTVKAPKTLIDFSQTLSNRIQYPHEKEISLKGNGFGADIVKVEPFQASTDIDDLIGTPDDFDFEF